MSLLNDIDLFNVKAGNFADGDPFLLRVNAAMGRVSQSLDLLLKLRTLGVLRRQRIHEDIPPSVTEHSRHLAECQCDIVEMVGRQSRGDDLEACIAEWQALGRRLEKLGIANSDFREDLPGRGQHSLDRVRHDHRLHVRSQGKSSMAGAGTDIEDALIPGRVCEGHHQLEVPAGLVLAGGVRLCRFLPASLKNAHPVSLRRRC